MNGSGQRLHSDRHKRGPERQQLNVHGRVVTVCPFVLSHYSDGPNACTRSVVSEVLSEILASASSVTRN